jgi:hypothetical protein
MEVARMEVARMEVARTEGSGIGSKPGVALPE